jgi:cell division protease FtsH
LNALCRALARLRLRERIARPTTPDDIDRALTEWLERPKMTPGEERVVATHEAGHAVCSLFCPHSPPIERISIRADMAGALGFVRYQDPTRKYVVTRGELLDDLCVLLGGREAEQLLLDDMSIGCSGDLRRATEIARALVEEFGMGGDAVGLERCMTSGDREHQRSYSPAQLESIDRSVRNILHEAQRRATAILTENRQLVEMLRDLLVEHKVIEAKTLATVRQQAAAPSP